MKTPTTTTNGTAPTQAEDPNVIFIIALPNVQAMMTGVSQFRFTADGKTLSAVYQDGTSEVCHPGHDTMITLLAIASCVRQDKAIPDFSAFALVSEVQSLARA